LLEEYHPIDRQRHTPLRSISGIIAVLFALVLLALWWHNTAPTRAATTAQTGCATADLEGRIRQDTTISGDRFMTGDVTVRNTATLTIEAGTTITVCGNYMLKIGDIQDGYNGQLIAEGTANSPIVFATSATDRRWRGLLFDGTASTVTTSTLRYVTINNGGGSDATADTGTININASDGTAGATPVIDHVTITNSGAYGIYTQFNESDDTPPLLSNLTISDSERAPISMDVSAIDGLGTGNTFANNAEQTINVRAGTVLGGRVYHDQTWRPQPIPHKVVSDFGQIAIGSEFTPTVTIEPGTNILMGAGAGIIVRNGHLHAVGTTDTPITIDSAAPDQKWPGISFSGTATTILSSTLRYMSINNGGGSDATADTGAIDIYASDGTAGATPVIDHVTITNSGSYGIYVNLTEAAMVPVLSNLTISGSARAPLMLYVAAMDGLGRNNTLNGNAEDVVEVRAGTVRGGRVYYDQTWRQQPVPYKVVSDFGVVTLSNRENQQPVVMIEPGTTVTLAEGAGFWVQSGGLIAEGTPTRPITFTHVSETSPPWVSLHFEGGSTKSSLAHVAVMHSGSEDGAIQVDDSSLDIEHATVSFNAGPGINVSDGFVQVVNSTLENNRVGALFTVGSRGLLRDSSISNNKEGGVINDDSRGACVDAVGNYWGSSDGPADSSDASDDCNQATSNDGSGSVVSDNVLYRPWRRSADGSDLQDASSIEPESFWVIADGVSSSELVVTVRDAQGIPQPGKQVELSTTRGTLTQPTAPTDEDGRTTAVISSTETGSAVITARNVTDDQDLAAFSSIYFWQGRGETVGLIQPGGVPFAAPQLILEGQPFRSGLPMNFRVPMRNTNAVPVDVTVSYGVSNLGIGARFTEVDQVSKTLQPAEAWDAPGSWIVTETGHRCGTATLEVTIDDELVAVQEVRTVNVGPFQVNFDVPEDPCKEQDASKLIPRGSGLSGVRKHFKEALIQTYLVRECLKKQLTFSTALNNTTLAQMQRDYQVVVEVPEYTPPPVTVEGDITAAQEEAFNRVAEAAANAIALKEAVNVTGGRIRGAGQAGDREAAARQMAAYRDFRRRHAEALQTLADSLDTALEVTEEAGVPDQFFTPQDYQEYLTRLQTSGYDPEVRAFHEQSGLTSADIDTMLQEEIERLQMGRFTATSLYALLREVRDTARQEAEDLRKTYGTDSDSQATLSQDSPRSFAIDPIAGSFVVANPTDSRETINLTVRPVNLPINWSYSLDNPAPVLDAGEDVTITLTLSPGDTPMVEGTQIQVAVEGTIEGDYIGGIVFERWAPGQPRQEPEAEYRVFLPSIFR
jgi:hypothetical protein